MSTENETTYESTAADERHYSSFWPQVIVMGAIIIWAGYQCVISISQNSALDNEFKQAQPMITAAQQAQSRLYALAQDVNQTAAHDNYAAQIVKDFNIQLQPHVNSATVPGGH